MTNFKSHIPMSVKKHLVLGKWSVLRLPHILHYHAALFQHASVEKQIQFLPTPAKPPIYWTELKKIKLYGSLDYPPAGRLCQDGDWDLNMVYPLPSIFESIPESSKKWDVHETIRLIFIYGKHYSTTPQYKIMINAVKQNLPNPPQKCRTVKDVDHYFQSLIEAFRSMQSNGYLTQEEQGKSCVGEIRLHLTREGILCLGTGGNHRVRLAEILGIQWVPFLLRGVHPDWILKLSKQMSLPPHKAITEWMSSQFYNKKPVDY